jgi:hypothetical protein
MNLCTSLQGGIDMALLAASNAFRDFVVFADIIIFDSFEHAIKIA